VKALEFIDNAALIVAAIVGQRIARNSRSRNIAANFIASSLSSSFADFRGRFAIAPESSLDRVGA
jgi:hypothetical protein